MIVKRVNLGGVNFIHRHISDCKKVFYQIKNGLLDQNNNFF